MNQRIKNIKDTFLLLLVGALTIVMLVLGLALQNQSHESDSVLGVQQSADVTVTASVQSCLFRIKVYPEKRIPLTGNWATSRIEIDFFDLNSNYLGQVVTYTEDDGMTPSIDICDELTPLPSGQYILRVRGLSHLRSRYPAVTMFDSVESIVNLVPLKPPLLAGETSIVFDNFINGLDLSTQVNALYTGDTKNDLNQDGMVNSLDLSNTVYNLYLFGDN